MTEQLNSDYDELFRQYVADVVPLRHDCVELFQVRTNIRPLPPPRHLEELQTHITVPEYAVVTDDILNFVRSGVQDRLLQKLRQGHITPQLELDLHGLTVVHAQESLELFLAESRRQALRCVRIIHGKGLRTPGTQAILKCKVNYWLRCYDFVLAFTSAPRWDGGSGAVYVLLRNPLKEAKRQSGR